MENETDAEKVLRHLKRSPFETVKKTVEKEALKLIHDAFLKYGLSRNDADLDIPTDFDDLQIIAEHGWTEEEFRNAVRKWQQR